MKLGKKKNEVVKANETDVVPVETRNVNIQEIKQVDKKKKKAKKQSDKLGFNWVLFVCLVIIAIPCSVFLWILLSAMEDTGTPILGNRFLSDLNPAIQTTQVEQIDQKIEGLDGVEVCETNLIVATLRINVDAKDALTYDEMQALSMNIYSAVTQVLPVETYFSQFDGQQQYDLEINVYNNLDFEEEFIMFNVVKNSPMETYLIHDVSTPIDAELAQELRDNVAKRDNPKQETDDASGDETTTE